MFIIFLLIRVVFLHILKNCFKFVEHWHEIRHVTIVYIYNKDKNTNRKYLTAGGCSAIGQKHEYTLAFCNAVETILLLVYTRYDRSVLVIVRQVNALPDMRRAARISMYRGITHLRQIISSLNYIFPRRTPVVARVYFAFTSSIDENKNRISRPFSASPLHRLRAAVSRSRFVLCKLPLPSVTDFYGCRAKKATVRGVYVFLIRSHSSLKITKCWMCKKLIIKLILLITFTCNKRITHQIYYFAWSLIFLLKGKKSMG